MPLDMSRPENKEIARIRALRMPQTVTLFRAGARFKDSDGKERQFGPQVKSPPKDFVALRLARKSLWSLVSPRKH